MTDNLLRVEHEIAHGRALAAVDPELAWGWGTPAGQRRAARRAALIVEAAGLGPGVSALEVGCGSGLFTERFAATGVRVVAIDVSEDLLDRARARRLDPARVTFRCQPLEERSGERFDVVIGSSVLHHLDTAPALAAIHSMLRPGGRMVFAEPNFLNPQVFLERTLRGLPMFWYVSPDESAIVRWRFARELRRVGFHDVTLRPFDWLHPAVPRSFVAAVSRAGFMLERTPVLREFAGSILICARRSA